MRKRFLRRLRCYEFQFLSFALDARFLCSLNRENWFTFLWCTLFVLKFFSQAVFLAAVAYLCLNNSGLHDKLDLKIIQQLY